jgi:hypothetical protein
LFFTSGVQGTWPDDLFPLDSVKQFILNSDAGMTSSIISNKPSSLIAACRLRDLSVAHFRPMRRPGDTD